MAKRTNLLIRDVARLFVDYKLDDWQPVLLQLRVGSVVHREIAQAIEDLVSHTLNKKVAQRAKAASGAKNIRRKRKAVDTEHPISPDRRGVLQPIRKAMNQRELLPTTDRMREAYRALGIKTKMPLERTAAIEGLLRFLDTLPEQKWRTSVALLTDPPFNPKADPQEDYRRWFDVITRESDRSGPSRD